jgi:hypothetical protein
MYIGRTVYCTHVVTCRKREQPEAGRSAQPGQARPGAAAGAVSTTTEEEITVLDTCMLYLSAGLLGAA